MTFDREPDLDNANVGMPEQKLWEKQWIYRKLPNQVASFFICVIVLRR